MFYGKKQPIAMQLLALLGRSHLLSGSGGWNYFFGGVCTLKRGVGRFFHGILSMNFINQLFCAITEMMHKVLELFSQSHGGC